MGSQETRKVVYQGVFVLGLGGDLHLLGLEELHQVRVGGGIALKGFAVGELPGDFITLQDDLGYLVGLHQIDEFAVINGGLAPGMLHRIEVIEQEDHHQGDEQPQGDIFIERA